MNKVLESLNLQPASDSEQPQETKLNVNEQPKGEQEAPINEVSKSEPNDLKKEEVSDEIEKVEEQNTTNETKVEDVKEGNTPIEIVINEPKPKPQQSEEISIDESRVIDFLKSNGVEVETLDDLKVNKVQSQNIVSDELLAIQAFMQETGKSVQDYIEINKDWSSVDDKQRIQKYLEEAKGYVPKRAQVEIDMLFNNTDVELEDMTDSERREYLYNEANREQLAKESLEYFEGIKSKYKAPEPPTEKEIQAHREAYIKQMNELATGTVSEVDKLTLKVGDMNIKYLYTDEDKELMKKSIVDPSGQILQRYYDLSNNTLTNPKQYAEDFFWVNKEVRDKMLSRIVEQVVNATIEQQSKSKRNVVLGETGRSKQTSQQGTETAFDFWRKNKPK